MVAGSGSESCDVRRSNAGRWKPCPIVDVASGWRAMLAVGRVCGRERVPGLFRVYPHVRAIGRTGGRGTSTVVAGLRPWLGRYSGTGMQPPLGGAAADARCFWHCVDERHFLGQPAWSLLCLYGRQGTRRASCACCMARHLPRGSRRAKWAWRRSQTQLCNHSCGRTIVGRGLARRVPGRVPACVADGYKY